jgi:hypothetical protein
MCTPGKRHKLYFNIFTTGFKTAMHIRNFKQSSYGYEEKAEGYFV